MNNNPFEEIIKKLDYLQKCVDTIGEMIYNEFILSEEEIEDLKERNKIPKEIKKKRDFEPKIDGE